MKEIIREEKITIIQFVGSVGGLLGLFMGLSFVSLVEILYMLLEWFFDKVKQRFNITNAVRDESQTTYTHRHRSQINAKVGTFLESVINPETKRY